MPKYTFSCEQCNTSKQMFVALDVKNITCKACNSSMQRQMPTLGGAADVRETVNHVTSTKHRQNQKELLRARNEEFFWKVEVPRLIQKYSVQTCLEEGWIWIDDAGKIHIHDKPPHKR